MIIRRSHQLPLSRRRGIPKRRLCSRATTAADAGAKEPWQQLKRPAAVTMTVVVLLYMCGVTRIIETPSQSSYDKVKEYFAHVMDDVIKFSKETWYELSTTTLAILNIITTKISETYL